MISKLKKAIAKVASRRQNLQAALPTPKIFQLPTDAFQHILSFLSLSSATALCLCSTESLNTVGSYHLEQLRKEQNASERNALLMLLSRDIDGIIACQHCFRLHLTTPPKVALTWKHDHALSLCELRSLPHFLRINIMFNYMHLQFAIKLNQQQKIDESEAHLLAMAVTRRTSSRTLAMRLKIIDGECIIRSQSWFMVPREGFEHSLDPFGTGTKGLIEFERDGFKICSHQYIYTQAMTTLLKGHLRHWVDNRFAKQDPVPKHYCCSTCLAEFTIDFKDCGINGIATVFTRWITLGTGLNPMGAEMQAQTESQDLLILARNNNVVNHQLSDGRLLKAFEGKEPDDFMPDWDITKGLKARSRRNRTEYKRNRYAHWYNLSMNDAPLERL